MDDRNQEQLNEYNLSGIEQEYALALSILENIDRFCTEDANQIAIESLQGMLHTQNLKILQQHYERLFNLLRELDFSRGTSNSEFSQNMRDLKTLLHLKQTYLNRWFSYLQFWSSQQWPHLNLLFLIVPLVVGIFVPPVGIAMLVFMAFYTTVCLFDFGVQSPNYWQWQDMPTLIEKPLTEQETDELQNEYPNLMKQIARPKADPTTSRLNDFLYYGDVIAISICVIALLALVFPPIGIPALALSILTGLAVFIGVTQWAIVLKHRSAEKTELADLKNKIEKDSKDYSHNNTNHQGFYNNDPKKWFKEDFTQKIEPHIQSGAEKYVTEHFKKAPHPNWLNNPLSTWYKPTHETSEKSQSQTRILSWFSNMLKWQQVGEPKEIEMKDLTAKKTNETDGNFHV